MSAARAFASRRLHLGAFATGVAAYHFLSPRRRITQLDAPAASRFSQDGALVNDARRAQTQRSRVEAEEAAKQPSKRGDADLIAQSTDADVYSPGFEEDEDHSWAQFSRSVDQVIEGIGRIQWAGLGDMITDYVVPTWARHIPYGIHKLQTELSMEPGTLADDIWQEAHDPALNPEILWDARVRVGNSLCTEELTFRDRRKQYIVKPFAKYLDIPEKDIDPEDVPTIAMCGSGGGLRALVAGTSSYISAQEAGLFQLATYTAGVSGSCWLQTLFYSSLAQANHKTLLRHIKSRVGTHIAFPPTALKLATSAPTNKFILSGFIEKLKGDPKADFGLVDIYSLLLGLRFMVPHGDLDVHPEDLKLSNQRSFIDQGQNPMPIYTAVRHEIPLDTHEMTESDDPQAFKEIVKDKVETDAWFQWIEMHPYEVGCEEFGAWIPTWSFGRPFSKGRNQIIDTGIALPEMRQTLLLGIWGSAFTATLAHYYKEIRPLLIGITGFSRLDDLLGQNNQDLVKIHPFEPATVPNWAYDMKEALPSNCPNSISKNDHLHLMDAGMSNNLPIYPLLRPHRDVDVLIAFDASADIRKENWLSVVDGYATQRGIKTWPVGTGWPKESGKTEGNVQDLNEAQAETPEQATARVAEAKEEMKERAKVTDAGGDSITVKLSAVQTDDLTTCNIWVGSKEERFSDQEPPPSKRLAWDDPEDSTFHLMKPDATIAVIYFPLLPNPKVPGVDPEKTEFLSTWNFIYTPEQVDKVVELARTNFQEGADPTKRTIRAVYERKKKMREEKENKSRLNRMMKKLKDHGDAFAHG